MKQLLVLIVVVAGLVPAGGCRTDRLETGYVPQRLGSTNAARRGYYAKPFSREAAEAQRDDLDRRPTQPTMPR